MRFDLLTKYYVWGKIIFVSAYNAKPYFQYLYYKSSSGNVKKSHPGH